MWKEIIRIRTERKTTVMRLPAHWARENQITKGSYVVCRAGLDGSLIVTTFESEVASAKGIKVRKHEKH